MAWIRTRKGRLLDTSFLNVPQRKKDGRWILTAKAWGLGTIAVGKYETGQEAEVEYRRFASWLEDGAEGLFKFRELPDGPIVSGEDDEWIEGRKGNYAVGSKDGFGDTPGVDE